ncbi:MAG: AAA family ATPase [Planctomycetes bacterium]|nr:AAA family ATPase [Planctomycetota bacterium]
MPPQANSETTADGDRGVESPGFAATGIAGLDTLLGGGFRRNRAFLVQGVSGSGKTTLGLKFAIHGAQAGEKVLRVGTSESEQEIREVAASHGWSLEGVTIYHHAPPEHGVDGVQTMFHPAEVELPRTIEAILSIVERVNPSRLVIDSLSEIRMLARDERWYRQQLITLKKRLVDRSCTVLLIDDRVAEQMLLRSLVSGVVELEQQSPEYGPDVRRLRIAKLRGQSFPTGYHDLRIRRGGLEVFPRLVAAEHRTRFEPELVKSGLPELDTLLGGGLDRGTCTLLLGPSGTGKSTIAVQHAVAAAERGERSAIYVFDERIQTLFQRSQALGLDLERHVAEGTVLVQQIDPAELTPGEFAHVVRAAVAEHKIRLVVLDSLSGYVYSMPQERFLMVHLHELLSFLNQQAVTSLLVAAEHGLVGARRSTFDVSYIVDTVILIRNFEHAGEVRLALSVYKRRGGPHERTIREVRLGPEGVTVGEPLHDFSGVLSGQPRFVGKALPGHPGVGYDAL